jgi:hypothetical protein
MQRLTAIALALLLCSATVACGGGDDDSSSTKDRTRSSEDTRGATGAGDPLDEGGPLDDDALEARLLTARDAGAGWTVDRSDDDEDDEDDDASDDDDTPACIRELDELEETDSFGEADVTLTAPDDVTELEQSLESYEQEDLDDLEAELDRGFAALDGCGEFEMDIEGSPATGSIERVEGAPSYGDRSGVWVMRIQVADLDFTSAFVAVLDGNIALSLTLTQLGGDAASDVGPYVDKALAKLAA